MSGWIDAFSSTPALRSILSDEAMIAAMLRFEAELAIACAEAGAAPAAAAFRISAVASNLTVDHATLIEEAVRAGTLAIPLVRRLTAEVRAVDPSAAGYVHLGATSQDVVDTAFALQARAAFDVIDADLARAIAAAAELAARWRDTPMLGRTLLQPATPITFGLKAAQWGLGLADARARFARSAAEAQTLQFGGAAGALGALGAAGPQVAARLGARLGLVVPPAPTHVRRSAIAGLCADAAMVVGASAKIARDVTLLSQAEIAECAEPAEEGRGGSSAMPHKRNPVRCVQILAAHARAPHLAATLIGAMDHEHERAAGGWQAEWSVAPECLHLAGGAAANAAALLAGLEVDPARLRANLDAMRGLPMSEAAATALAPRLGRDVAFALVERAAHAAAAGGGFGEALAASADLKGALSEGEIDALADPRRALGAAQAFVDDALARLRA